MNGTPWQRFWSSFSQSKSAILGLFVLGLLIGLALLAPWISPFDPAEQFTDALLKPPVWQEGGQITYFFGTDDLGRDMLSRLIYGARLSLGIGLLVVLVSMTAGLTLGAVAALRGGFIELAIMRLMDVMLALPSLLLAIVIVAVLGPSLVNAVFAVSLVYLPHFVRLVRGQLLAELKQDYVQAAKLDGTGKVRLFYKGLLPNISAPLIVQGTLSFSNAILDIAALGFLGLGAQPPTPEWGTILSASRQYIVAAPWTVTLPGLAILITVLATNLMGDGLRDALDPRLKRQ